MNYSDRFAVHSRYQFSIVIYTIFKNRWRKLDRKGVARRCIPHHFLKQKARIISLKITEAVTEETCVGS